MCTAVTRLNPPNQTMAVVYYSMTRLILAASIT